jgi:hypothetical protein
MVRVVSATRCRAAVGRGGTKPDDRRQIDRVQSGRNRGDLLGVAVCALWRHLTIPGSWVRSPPALPGQRHFSVAPVLRDGTRNVPRMPLRPRMSRRFGARRQPDRGVGAATDVDAPQVKRRWRLRAPERASPNNDNSWRQPTHPWVAPHASGDDFGTLVALVSVRRRQGRRVGDEPLSDSASAVLPRAHSTGGSERGRLTDSNHWMTEDVAVLRAARAGLQCVRAMFGTTSGRAESFPRLAPSLSDRAVGLTGSWADCSRSRARPYGTWRMRSWPSSRVLADGAIRTSRRHHRGAPPARCP